MNFSIKEFGAFLAESSGCSHPLVLVTTKIELTFRYIENAKFFEGHQDPKRPCYTHVCYPMKMKPFYFWKERFQTDKCCQYEG